MMLYRLAAQRFGKVKWYARLERISRFFIIGFLGTFRFFRFRLCLSFVPELWLKSPLWGGRFLFLLHLCLVRPSQSFSWADWSPKLHKIKAPYAQIANNFKHGIANQNFWNVYSSQWNPQFFTWKPIKRPIYTHPGVNDGKRKFRFANCRPIRAHLKTFSTFKTSRPIRTLHVGKKIQPIRALHDCLLRSAINQSRDCNKLPSKCPSGINPVQKFLF